MTRAGLRGRLAAGVAAALALVVALVPPAGYFFVSYQYVIGSLDAQADVSAREVTSLITSNPASWHFEELRLSELLQRRPATGERQIRRILGADARRVAEYGASLSRPTVTRSALLYDAGIPVGRVEVVQSLSPILTRAAVTGGASLLAGAAVFLFLGVYPRRLAEEALRSLAESEKRYRSLYRSMREGMALFQVSPSAGEELSISLLDVNPAMKAILDGRKTAGESGGADVLAALRARLAAIARADPTERTLTFEVAAARQGVYAVSAFFPEPGLVAALVEDVTELRRIQEERETLERKMFQAQKLESLGVLAGGIAHDFNNLLVGILGNVDLALARSAPEAVVRPYLERIETAAQRAADLTNQMLAYSGKGRFVVGPLDASRLVEETGHLLATVVSKTARIRYELAERLPAVEADATQLRQVVMNLITNASDAIGEREGTITVATGVVEADHALLAEAQSGENLPAGRYVSIDVTDTGHGMDAQTRARIFDPFFTTKQRGRGLGLAAVLGIVRAHRGALSVRTAPGEGTTFRVLLPALEGGVAAEPAPAPEPAGAAAPGGSAGTILVIDDEESVRAVTREVLEERGFTVWTARDGVEGVDLFRERHGQIDAVVLDMTMPRMGGDEACRAMHEIAPDVPVLLCSGYSDQEAARLSGPAAGFLQKPYRVQTLLASLTDLLARRAAAWRR